jgi:hypothetical protein
MRRELLRKDNDMPAQPNAVSFDKRVAEVISAEVVADAIPRSRATRLAEWVLTVAIIDENSRLAFAPESEAPSFECLVQWDGIQALEGAVNLMNDSLWNPHVAISVIIEGCFAKARNTDFLDTDEIRPFVGATYAAGILIRRLFPRMSEWWIRRGASA